MHYNLTQEIRSSKWLSQKIKANDSYAQNLYAALCDNIFQKNEFLTILKGVTWSCTWDHAGLTLSNIRGEPAEYFYYSGLFNTESSYEDDDFKRHELNYVSEGEVTHEVRQDLRQLGWIVCQ